MNILTVARIGAVISGAVTLLIMVMHGSFRIDNPFMIPDVVVSLLLIAGALAPKHLAPVTLLAAFGMSVGIFMTAAANQLINGEAVVATAIATLFSAVGAVVMAANIARKS